ncbi:MAG: hypothetical protein LBR16_03200, partial [Treponema sp.]|nr:hypothetical protein [Treponema sp.]
MTGKTRGYRALLSAGLLVPLVFGMACSAMLTDNFFSGLIPPNGDYILSFSVPGMVPGSTFINNKNNTVTIKTYQETSLNALVPAITVSPKARILPLTLPYLQAAFNLTLADLLPYMGSLNNPESVKDLVVELVKAHPDCSIPPLEEPVNFSYDVSFVVIGGQGAVRFYTVTIAPDNNGAAQLRSFGFSKYSNPELTKDAVGEIDEENKTIEVTAYYPVEYTPQRLLIPSFEVVDGSLFESDVLLASETSAIAFPPSWQWDASWSASLKAVKAGYDDVVYTLNVTMKQDPDTVRSITDFRFEKEKNSSLIMTALGVIKDSGDTGTIDLTVYYKSETLPALTPSFVSPGTVRAPGAGGAPQTSGEPDQNLNFADPAGIVYHVRSRDGLYTRDYTVKVKWISLSEATPKITAFGFSRADNVCLAKNAVGEFVDGTPLITVTVEYTGDKAAAYQLVPCFEAGGEVRVSGKIQTSGYNRQNFNETVKYTVTTLTEPVLSRDYWVEVHYQENFDADAALTAFWFRKEDNPDHGWTYDPEGVIDQERGTIDILFPAGTNLDVPLTPSFVVRAGVEVKAGGTPQTSGLSSGRFDSAVTYTVKSKDGTNTSTYTVSAVTDQGAGRLLYFGVTNAVENGLSRDLWQPINSTTAAITAYYAPEAAAPASLPLKFEIWGDSVNW